MKNEKYKFERHGAVGGIAFALEGIEGLRAKVRELRDGLGSSCTALEIEELGHVLPEHDTAVRADDFLGAGWYVCYWDGSSNFHGSETGALIELIEERTETRLVHE